ncbi:hypothetical protein X797_000072 [Metarhizium robertsii]|uniref:Uncharacterized protein n=1 Tax=Metarhizium robertsii TaxID=568076 RepID=A0A0A1V695_9HYPO|nr:hypothetical protein X797_000072 [Metarhizium robertsii]
MKSAPIQPTGLSGWHAKVKGNACLDTKAASCVTELPAASLVQVLSVRLDYTMERIHNKSTRTVNIISSNPS